MDGEIASDEPETTPIAQWKRDTFYVAVDTVMNFMRKRFEKNRPLLQSLAMFSPSGFAELTETFQNSRDLIAGIVSARHMALTSIDPSRCAEELFTFVPSFSKFNRSFFSVILILQKNIMTTTITMIQTIQMMMKNSQTKQHQTKMCHPFLEALEILTHPYCLVDPYPSLCKVYAIAVVIPTSSSTTVERSFSALKRVKSSYSFNNVARTIGSLIFNGSRAANFAIFGQRAYN